MDALARKHLEERVEKKVSTILIEGDQDYLQGLSRDALLEVLEKELRFLGFYSHEDRETPVLIRDLLERKLDEWWQKPTLWVRLTKSPPLTVEFSSTGGDSLETETIHHFNFAPIWKSISIGSADSAEAENTQHHNFAQTD